MENNKQPMAIWRRPRRLPSARNIAIVFVLLLVLNYFRAWGMEYAASSSPQALTQPPEAPEPLVETSTDSSPEAPAAAPAEIPEEIPFQAADAQLPVVAPRPGRIPKKIWYKLGPKGLSYEANLWTDTCISQNPEYHAEFLTDESADDFVREKYADRPDIVATYMALTIPIVKADMLRYLLLYSEGGVWFDLDVSCEGIPVDEWIPQDLKEDVGLVVGWEFDAGYPYPFERQFTTWAVMAEKGSRHLIAVVEDIVRSVERVAKENNATIPQLKMDMVGDVVELTGPRRFAKSVTESVRASLNGTSGWKGWDEYYEILEPKLAGDVLILPGYSLAALFNTYEEGGQGPSLVVHHYAGSWKNDYGGERAEEQEKPYDLSH
ncbi:hypothetical protein KVR01_000631 [Diaporthe batatas]|uniref:uncharacterized protein n=1 Tax=Diaporthe batatas TaxID=748121 RepID=UPI001D042B5D|nr:uncharacterized protein KVR01_000631 [Diaporthe batatas]KAG8169886.1 hypothetical protein KVR01_000631 [Diaporthe batatas]